MEEMMKGWKEEIKLVVERVMEGIRDHGGKLREEMEGLRKDIRERKVRWKEERR